MVEHDDEGVVVGGAGAGDDVLELGVDEGPGLGDDALVGAMARDGVEALAGNLLHADALALEPAHEHVERGIAGGRRLRDVRAQAGHVGVERLDDGAAPLDEAAARGGATLCRTLLARRLLGPAALAVALLGVGEVARDDLVLGRPLAPGLAVAVAAAAAKPVAPAVAALGATARLSLSLCHG